MTISSLGRLLVAVLVLSSSTTATAHPPKAGEQPHSHGPGPMSRTHALAKDEIVKRAKAARDRLIREQKIDAAWETAAEPSIEQKEFNGRPEWVVTFRNPVAGDTTKEALYIFFTPAGRFVAANHTGK